MKDKYKNILVIITGLALIAWIFSIPILGKATIVLGILTILIPQFATFIDWIWLKLAFILGWINSKILLGILFFIFLMPLALISRIFTKDPLNLKGRALQSLYADRNHLYTKDDLENIW